MDNTPRCLAWESGNGGVDVGRHLRADRQPHPKRGSGARLGVALDLAAVAVDHYIADDREALAGSLTDVLGREERLEDPLADLGRHAAAIVFDLDDNVLPLGPGPRGDQPDRVAFAARVGDRVAGVDDQVEQDLANLVGQNLRHRQVGVGVDLELRRVLPAVACQRDRAVEQRV